MNSFVCIFYETSFDKYFPFATVTIQNFLQYRNYLNQHDNNVDNIIDKEQYSAKKLEVVENFLLEYCFFLCVC